METMILVGDTRESMTTLPAESVQCCVTSPPYWGLRDYGCDGQLGLEKTPDEYVAAMVDVFRGVRRVLRDDGTLWLNLGDSYYSTTATQGRNEDKCSKLESGWTGGGMGSATYRRDCDGLKPKDLVGIPWRVAFALQADGWYLRSDIIWAKPNPMPESVTDRPTKAHEYVFLLSKSARYFYDADAVREANSATTIAAFGTDAPRTDAPGSSPDRNDSGGGGTKHCGVNPAGRNKRSVWTVTTQPYPGAHFAVMPRALVEPCILAGSRVGDTVMDPFAGTATVGVVAKQHGREFIGCELNPEYAQLAEDRLRKEAGQGLLFTPSGELTA